MSTKEHGFGSAVPPESEEGISCEMSQAVDGTIKEPNVLSLLNKMNDTILSSNTLLADFLSQHTHVMPQGHASKVMFCSQILSRAMNSQFQKEGTWRPVPRFLSTQIEVR